MTRERPRSRKSSKRKVQIEMTSLSLFLWGFCLFFLLGWIFLLGILVGRGSLPATVPGISELKDQVNKLQEMITPNRNSGVKPNRKEDLDPKLAFYERLADKKDDAKTVGVPEKEGRGAPKVSGSVNDQTARDAEQATRAASAGMADAKKDGATSSKGKPGPSSPRVAQFTVQLASVEEKNSAEGMIRRLVEKGYDAYYSEAKVRGKTYYRIRSGRFTNREEADAFARKLANAAGIRGYVTSVE